MPGHSIGTGPHPHINGVQIGLLDPLTSIVGNLGQQFIPVDAEEPILHGFGDTQVE